MGRRRLFGLRMVMHPLPCDEEFDLGSMRFGATSELLQLPNSSSAFHLSPFSSHCSLLTEAL